MKKEKEPTPFQQPLWVSTVVPTSKHVQDKVTFLRQISKKICRANLENTLALVTHHDWQVRAEVAKILEYYVFQVDDYLRKAAIRGLKHLEDDPHTIIRLQMIELKKKIKRHGLI